MSEITSTKKASTQSMYAPLSSFNAEEYHIRSLIDKTVFTGFLAKIESCSSSGEGGTKTVIATPLIAQTDAEGNALTTSAYQELPHYRFQAGIAAIIMDPEPNDIGVFLCMKSDVSNINSTTTATSRPASFRKFNPADAIMVATIHTKDPKVWIHLKQDQTIVLHAPKGYTVETDEYVHIKCKTCTVDASDSVTVNTKTATVSATTVNIKSDSVTIDAPSISLNGNVQIAGTLTSGTNGGGTATFNGDVLTNGNITSQKDVIASGTSLHTHTHNGVYPGSGNTGTPN